MYYFCGQVGQIKGVILLSFNSFTVMDDQTFIYFHRDDFSILYDYLVDFIIRRSIVNT